MTDPKLGERISAAEAWITGHEKLCAERYGELKGDLRWVIRGVFGILLGVVAWLAVQLWNGSQARLAALEHPSAADPIVTSHQTRLTS